ncbi:MAG: NADP(H)-dependent aldo-keto reductase [Zetaproteobacteria bacterium CG_4_9_14_3_um_filter_49_83]|nr:MAG: aldo/keto reductase [Zetaproteobacteria bacterium CG1_02_49_23]PIQ34252.1 MAG: NADP(H)-dependent aldo-keto reductase [Zetaproteobacteria bacterium CG17_big_fil_post_rev_8_21_14_2_50_50_13]PIV29554.1 MAG: NADP(H)-dependent aldo-keto reductase [Zetaproteobacteria bacterium CG02_land_8_20_14_3_00_50_9]PIY54962.1 MAG: NADP(H)-dependent aldo-keto reductase [Zetaproteobacteria bacterium CG_4_10_14_0_8_um_filter_49_80]PJA34171.1 MAG: NADP(H)-dependent aldo-keto reductase [Zetaproteobacteria ba
MEYRQLGSTDIRVSTITLGSMTWGMQNSACEAFEQLDYALDKGINFIDTAELYAIPPTAETYGKTETIIGQWLAQSGQRQNIILASKVCGPTAWVPHIRQGKARLTRQQIVQACEDSLKRLQTDYLDLYQVHWPERPTNFFGRLGFEPDSVNFSQDTDITPIDETLSALHELVQSGKVRHVGISNETPWGLMQYLSAATERDLTRIVSIQNPYSLLNRSFEIGLAECAYREHVGLLAYSPLGFGMLSGKYDNGALPANGRITLFENYQRYRTAEGIAATHAYSALAREHGLDPAQMALAFIRAQPFVTSVIIGATNMQQLTSNIASADLNLSGAVNEGIQRIHKLHPNPCP